MSRYAPVDPKQSFPALEEDVLERWRQGEIFRRQLEARAGRPLWSFYEGPPTANGQPGSHHVLARVFKDIYPRYKSMCGFDVPRKGGWDCHGLPVELEIEKQLGISSKEEIEAFGIAEFNQRCRESVFAYVGDWNRMIERVGHWIDLDDPYVTMDTDYIESVWWSLRRNWDDDRLYEGHKVVPYCPRCGTALSSHEVAVGYKDVVDPSVYVRLPVTEPAGPLEAGDDLLVWTTTPWTLISHAAVAAGPEIDYVRAALPDGEIVVVALALAGRVLGEDYETLATLKGAELEGSRYEAPFGFIAGAEFGPLGHSVLMADFVTTEDGTGLVHTALAFGEDDFRLGRQYGMTLQNPVRLDGTYDERVPDFQGKLVRDHNPEIVAALAAKGRLFKEVPYEHAYPHCWRCDTPLIYYAKSCWYLRTSEVRDRMLAENERIGWHPEHIKHGRFGKWLEGNVDWALSRERYWGTPLPVWDVHRRGLRGAGLHRLDRRDRRARRRAAALGGGRDRPPPPLHRRGHPRLPGLRRRDAARRRGDRHLVRQRRDAVRAAPLPVRERGGVRAALPGRLHLRGDRPDPGLVLLTARRVGPPLRPDRLSELRLPRAHPRSRGPEDGKRLGNIVDPHEVIDAHGADAFRWYYLDLPAAVGGLPVQRRHGRRIGPAVPADALEHLLVLRPLRQCRRRAGRPATAERGRGGARPLAGLPPAGDDGDRPRPPRRLRLDERRQGDRPVRRRDVELVRAGLAPSLLGRRRGRVRHAPPLPRRDREAARPVHPVHRRRDLAQPRSAAPNRHPRRPSTSRTTPSPRTRCATRPSSPGSRRRGGRSSSAGPPAHRPR